MNQPWDGNEIRRQRDHLGWTPQQLADALGVARRDVEAWETGHRQPPGRYRRDMERLLAPIWTGAEIRRRRNEKNWTQQELADALGKGRRTIISWESNDATPQGRNLQRLMRVLGDTPPADTSTDGDEPGPGGLLLADADFPSTINRLIDLYNAAVRGSINQVLRVEDTPLPPEFTRDHDVVAGPPIGDLPAEHHSAPDAEQAQPNE